MFFDLSNQFGNLIPITCASCLVKNLYIMRSFCQFRLGILATVHMENSGQMGSSYTHLGDKKFGYEGKRA